ncbi:ATP-binding cassette domain-containing protein [Pectinatus sottacetonis]|uniref:ATP-binding cassette domain-containing protein n=1 Tax=Pectinatus sottacetonis TaxID=1002795 RepID=UPI0018C533CB|nr:excinuclease ABC subunit UvrA [Pectinatus sottacetonis]
MNDYIEVFGAREKNLKNIDIKIPKNKITVFTGVSGSGKSSLVFDTLAAESQRQLNETYTSFIRQRMPRYGKPDVDKIKNLTVVFIITQKRLGGNARSTVGTITDIYSLLRLLFSRIGKPFVGYSDVFSFNNAAGMCSYCEGLGKTETIDIKTVLNFEKSLNEGAILFPTFEVGGWRLTRYTDSGFFDNNKKINDYTDKELELLLYGDNIKINNPPPEWHKTSLYEGIIPRIERSFLKKENGEKLKYIKAIEPFVIKQECKHCHGMRLKDKVLLCKINGKNIAECTNMNIDSLFNFIKNISDIKVNAIILEITKRLQYIISMGMGYLSLNRETSTLSGGESQRIKMINQLGSSLTGLTYIFDEPSIGLHPYDIGKINNLLKLLRDKGNTVVIVDHDPDVIEIADHVIDIGPGAGKCGGNITYQGNVLGLKKSNTITGKFLRNNSQLKSNIRMPKDWFYIKNARMNNLINVSVNIPKGVMTVVTGIAGAGKSTLVNGILTDLCKNVIIIDQKSIQTSKRSNIATFTGIFDIIRKLFARNNGIKASLLSFNSKGACQNCKGLGVTYTDLSFLDTVVTTCEKCRGKRYTDEVLTYRLREKNIADILEMTVDEALDFFHEKEIVSVLKSLSDVGIGYISLGQSLNTFSGGELQRLKLAKELENTGEVYIFDEPSTGLHMSDIKKLMTIMDVILAKNNTIIIIEHNLEIISQADWIIDLGPYAGDNGGKIVFSGLSKDIINCKLSLTGKYLRKYINENE